MLHKAAFGSDSEALPVAPGESKFQIKGIAYRGIVEFMKSQGDSFLDDVLESLPEDMREFCGQPFMAASWYDALPIRTFTRAVATRLGLPHVKYLRMGGAKQAAMDARTVYRHVMEGQPPFEVVRRQVTIGLRYYSFIEGGCVLTDENKGEVMARGMPQYLVSWFMPMQEAYTAETMRRSGAKNPVVRAELKTSPNLEPLEPTEMVFKVSWEL